MRIYSTVNRKIRKLLVKVAIKRYSFCFHHTKWADYFNTTLVLIRLKSHISLPSFNLSAIQCSVCLFVWYFFCLILVYLFFFILFLYFQIFSKVNINSTISSSIVKFLLCSKKNKFLNKKKSLFDCILVYSYVCAISPSL